MLLCHLCYTLLVLHRITLANADFALAREDVDEALSLLRNIGEENRYYIQAKEKMADIYLNRKLVL